jgi:hypothetical protein
MNITTNGETRHRSVTTADLAASANGDVLPEVVADKSTDGPKRREELAPLFSEAAAGDFRARWSIVQQGFVDDPKVAVRQGDELVAQVIKSLAETFASQRAALEGEQGSTEDLRLALRRYRSFFDRLLSI